MIDRGNWSTCIWVGLAGLMCAVLFFGVRQHPGSFDDAYITYRYARNIALGRGFVYNIGEPVLGTTTPLYAVLLAVLSLIWPDIPVLSHYIGVLAWMLCVPLIYGIGQAGGRQTVGLAAAAFIALNALFLRALGMETSVYVLLVLLTFYLHLKERTIWAALCASLAFLTRWDGVLAVGTLLFAEMLRRKDRFLRASLVCASIIIPWLVYSYVTFGSIFPNTFFAKVGQGSNPNLGGAQFGDFGRGLLLTATSTYAENHLFVLLPLFWMPGLFSVFRRRVRWWFLLLWTGVYVGGYIALGVIPFGWYYPPVMPGLALLTAEGIEAVVEFASPYLKYRGGRPLLITVFCTLCLIPHIDWMVKSHRTEMDAHSATYVEVGQWLQEHTPPDSSVALLEIGIIGFYSDRTVIDTMGLVSPDMVGHLEEWLQTLHYAVNYYWPDYVVGLRGTAWEGVVDEPWFKESYVLETRMENSADPVAPASIYRLRNGFPPREFAVDSSPELWFDQAFRLRRVQIVEDHAKQGDRLHSQLTWEAQADISVDYRFRFDLVNVVDGEHWTLADGLQPMRGGNPTTQWRRGDRVIDSHSLIVPGDVPAGSYNLQVVVTRGGEPVPVSDAGGSPLDNRGAGPIAVKVVEPTCSMTAVFEDNIRLIGYDLERSVSNNALSVTLYWEATGRVSSDYTVFVHLLSPEGELVAQHDAPPLRPTGSWARGVREIDAHTLTLPSELSPADHQVRVGWYHWPDLKRVPIIDPDGLDAANDTLLLGFISLDDLQATGGVNCPHLRWMESGE